MATYEQLIAAAQQADAAGETGDARRLLEMAVALRDAPAPLTERPRSQLLMDEYAKAEAAGDHTRADQLLAEASYTATQDGSAPAGVAYNPANGRMEDLTLRPNGGRGQAAAQGLGQGLGFGLMDETVGALYGATGPGSYDQNRDYALASMRADLDSARKNYPVTAYGAEIAGGAASSMAGASALGLQAAPTVAGRAVQGGAIGAGEGALYGFGAGSGDIADRAWSAGKGFLLGGATGAAAPYAIEGVRQGFDKAVAGPVASMRSGASEVRASRAVQSALERSGRTVDEIDRAIRGAAGEGQPMYAVADAMGTSGQRMLAGAARTPGAARQEIIEYLAGRQDGQADRLGRFVSEALEAPDTAAARISSLKAQRGAAATTAYDAARQGSGAVNLNDAIQTIDDLMKRNPILGESALGKTDMGGKLSDLRGKLTNDASQLIDFDDVLSVKQDLGSVIKQAKKSGGVPPELAKVYGALDAALENASPAYRQANDNFARASKVIDQVDAGKAATSSRVRADDSVSIFNSLSPEEQAAFRAGYADPVIARIESQAPGVNSARALTTPKAQTELGAMANDPALLSRRVGRENDMFRTMNAASGGSMTADNLADIADVNAFNANPIINLLTGRWGAAATQLGDKAINTVMGRNTATREEIARLLMSGDVKKAVAPAAQRALTNAKQSAIVSALMRAAERSGNPL